MLSSWTSAKASPATPSPSSKTVPSHDDNGAGPLSCPASPRQAGAQSRSSWLAPPPRAVRIGREWCVEPDRLASLVGARAYRPCGHRQQAQRPRVGNWWTWERPHGESPARRPPRSFLGNHFRPEDGAGPSSLGPLFVSRGLPSACSRQRRASIRTRDVGWGTPDPDFGDGPLYAGKPRIINVLEDAGARSLKYLHDFCDGTDKRTEGVRAGSGFIVKGAGRNAS